jgi:hypothetical protein
VQWPKVSLWQCSCGAHFKAVCEINDKYPNRSSTIKCHLCNARVEIDGRVEQVFCQTDLNEWKVVTPAIARDTGNAA